VCLKLGYKFVEVGRNVRMFFAPRPATSLRRHYPLEYDQQFVPHHLLPGQG